MFVQTDNYNAVNNNMPTNSNDQDKQISINIIINNNNNNNYLVNGVLPQSYKEDSPKKSQCPTDFIIKQDSGHVLLDFTHKYDKTMYQHRKNKKYLGYPDVPPNSFSDSFDVEQFLDTVRQIDEHTKYQVPMSNASMNFSSSRKAKGPYQLMLNQPVVKNKYNNCSINENQKKDESEENNIDFEYVNDQNIDAGENQDKKYFKTTRQMKDNAPLQLRKIKFFWRGTQTNLPYIFKKKSREKNQETEEMVSFETFDYSQKKIKIGLNDDENEQD